MSAFNAARSEEIPDAKRRLPHWRHWTRRVVRPLPRLFQTPKGVCLIGGIHSPAAIVAIRQIPDAKRRLPHWRLCVARARAAESGIPDAKRRLPHWSALFIGSPSRKASIPDAKRRLPHWSGSARQDSQPALPIPDAKRRLPHWSLLGAVHIGAALTNSRRQKASASLECVIPFFGRVKEGIIPDAKRRLPHWSYKRDSAFLTPIGAFQTPKGVCLIGVSSVVLSYQSADPIPDAKRRLPHWSAFAVGGLSLSQESEIPDAKRRLPHWSSSGERRNQLAKAIPDAKRRLPHWSLEEDVRDIYVVADSRRQKASASLESICSAT